MPRTSFSTPRHVPSETLECHRYWPDALLLVDLVLVQPHRRLGEHKHQIVLRRIPQVRVHVADVPARIHMFTVRNGKRNHRDLRYFEGIPNEGHTKYVYLTH